MVAYPRHRPCEQTDLNDLVRQRPFFQDCGVSGHSDGDNPSERRNPPAGVRAAFIRIDDRFKLECSPGPANNEEFADDE